MTRGWTIAATFAALGPVWAALYAALLSLPVSPEVTRAVAPAARALQIASSTLVLPWGVPLFGFPIVGLLKLNCAPGRTAAFERRASLRLLMIGGLAWAALPLAFPVWHLRYAGASACARHSESVLAALETFRRSVGHYPNKLQELTPRYLAEPPSPNLLAYSQYQYQRFPDGDDRGGYELSVPMGHVAWDFLFYWPSERYPDTVPAGNVVRLHRWAYVRE